MITFTRVVQTYTADTDVMTSTTSTITGSAIQVQSAFKQDKDLYEALGLRRSEAPTLFFSPTTYGDVPAPGDTVTWPATNGSVYTVRDVDRIAPDGVLIAARIIISK